VVQRGSTSPANAEIACRYLTHCMHATVACFFDDVPTFEEMEPDTTASQDRSIVILWRCGVRLISFPHTFSCQNEYLGSKRSGYLCAILCIPLCSNQTSPDAQDKVITLPVFLARLGNPTEVRDRLRELLSRDHQELAPSSLSATEDVRRGGNTTGRGDISLQPQGGQTRHRRGLGKFIWY